MQAIGYRLIFRLSKAEKSEKVSKNHPANSGGVKVGGVTKWGGQVYTFDNNFKVIIMEVSPKYVRGPGICYFVKCVDLTPTVRLSHCILHCFCTMQYRILSSHFDFTLPLQAVNSIPQSGTRIAFNTTK